MSVSTSTVIALEQQLEAKLIPLAERFDRASPPSGGQIGVVRFALQIRGNIAIAAELLMAYEQRFGSNHPDVEAARVKLATMLEAVRVLVQATENALVDAHASKQNIRDAWSKVAKMVFTAPLVPVPTRTVSVNWGWVVSAGLILGATFLVLGHGE